MKTSAKLTISGTVQGVFFRQFVKESADKFNLKGFVRNLDNGDVEVVVEGDSDNIQKMIEVCKKGPPHAQIRNVNVEEKKWQGQFEGFKVLRGF